MEISPIITLADFFKIHQNTDVLLFDASTGTNAKQNFNAEHLAGAIFVDLDTQLADIKSDFAKGGRHPLPLVEKFAETLTALGVSKNKHLVIYDSANGSNAAARFWWMLKSIGHEKVQVLNGGLQEAKKHNFPLSSKTESVKKAPEPYPVSNWKLPTIKMDELEKLNLEKNHLVLDVRAKNRYDGIYEPIDLIAGHIPGAINIPFTENLDTNGLFLNPTALRELYSKQFSEIPPSNISVHCGSGITACHTLLALAYAGMGIPNLYVGSWSEWSRNNKTIAVTELS